MIINIFIILNDSEIYSQLIRYKMNLNIGSVIITQ